MIIGLIQRTWLRRAALGTAACLLVAGTAGQAAAQDPAPDPDKITLNFFKNTEVGGLVDGYYQWYSTKQNGLYRAFDQSHNAFTVSMAEVWIAKPATSDSRVGYKVRMNFGEASHVYTPAADTDFKNIEEAYGSYLAGKATIDFGKFVTNAGAEVVEAKDNWNYTRSLLFQLTIPVYHAGIRMNYAANDKVSFMVGVVERLEQRRGDQQRQDLHGVDHAQAQPQVHLHRKLHRRPGNGRHQRQRPKPVGYGHSVHAWWKAVLDGQPRLHQ